MDSTNVPKPSSDDQDNPDGIASFIKGLDANKYATKKTISQGLLDIALLTANASQLKYILQVGTRHEFYTLMLTLIIISIILQVVQAALNILLGSMWNINNKQDHEGANWMNNLICIMNIVVVAIDIIIGMFEMKNEDHV
ncbi:ninjurin-2 isoform X1 [Agrilus planipennis]|uniref:Ninjurin-2 isoform X1 n=1 Tax=Agrilus planipennis TaxID=224129 RepID=A0A1W4WC39_AGRPL|nr:ninjurin-2 isoform X1 [Agrilus planipennis]